MRRGTTTIKMINSTSTTSTSGVMLISDCRLEPDSLNCIMSISFRAGALGDQPDAAEAGLLDRGHDLPDLEKVKLCIPTEHDLGIRLMGYRSVESFAESFCCHGPIV